MSDAQKYALQAGDLRNLKLQTFEPEVPAPGAVRVAVTAIGLNFADIFAIWGLYGATPKGTFTPGLEYAGRIDAVGAGVTNLHVGDRVMGITRFGAYTTHLNIDARYVLPIPEGWDDATASAYLVQTLTAYYGMTALGNLRKGMTVLIHSAVGGVGLQALKIAKAYGCYTIGTIGTAAKTDFGLAQGYDHMIVRGPDFEQQLRSALGDRPLELVMDSVGGDYFKIPLRLLAPMGRIVVFGSARYATPGNKPNYLHLMYEFFRRPKIDPQKMVEKNTGVLGFNLIWLYERIELMQTLLQELDAMKLSPPHVGHRFKFEQMREAILLFQTGKTIGKVVVEV
jgi:NADPH:quinone reductase-like Zn-dependent oxidoreductase